MKLRSIFISFYLLIAVVMAQAQNRVFFDGFSNNSTKWTNYQGTWTRNNGVLNVTGAANTGGYRYITNSIGNVVVEAKVRFTNTTSWGIGLVGRYNPATGSSYSLWLYPNNPSTGVPRLTIERNSDWYNTWSELVGRSLSYSPGTNWHTLRLVINNNLITGYLDETNTIEASDFYWTTGSPGLTFWSSSGFVTRGQFDNFAVTNLNLPPPQPPSTNLTINLSWLPIGNALWYEVWSTTNIMRPLTLLTNVGLNTNVTFIYPKATAAPQRYYAIRGYYWTSTNTPYSAVTLAWDYDCNNWPTNTSAVNAYHVYYGVASSTYTNMVTALQCTNRMATVSNLLRGVTYFFAATAIDTNGLESDYSSEVFTTTPLPTYFTNAVGVACKISQSL